MTPYRPGQLVSKGLRPRLDQNIHLPICLFEYDEDLPSRLLTCLHGIPTSVYESELWKCDTDDPLVLLFGLISADKQVGVRDLTVLPVNPVVVVTPARACAAPTLDVKLYLCPFSAEFSCHSLPSFCFVVASTAVCVPSITIYATNGYIYEYDQIFVSDMNTNQARCRM